MSTNLLQTENKLHPEESASFTRVYYLFEAEAGSPAEQKLLEMVDCEFYSPHSIAGLDSYTVTECQSIGEALAEFVLTLGVLEELALWLAVMTIRCSV